MANLWKRTGSYVMYVCLSACSSLPAVVKFLWTEVCWGNLGLVEIWQITGTLHEEPGKFVARRWIRLGWSFSKSCTGNKSSRCQIQFFPQSCLYEVTTGKAKSEWSDSRVSVCSCRSVTCLEVTCFLIQTTRCGQTQLFNICHQCYILRPNEPSSDITMKKKKKKKKKTLQYICNVYQ